MRRLPHLYRPKRPEDDLELLPRESLVERAYQEAGLRAVCRALFGPMRVTKADLHPTRKLPDCPGCEPTTFYRGTRRKA